MWPISQSVTHFFQALPVFSTCNSFSQVWPNFQRVSHFSTCDRFLQVRFSKCDSFFPELTHSNCDTSSQVTHFSVSALTHFCKCYQFFYVWPIFWKWDFPSVDEDWLAQLPDFSVLHPSPMPVVSNKTSKHYEN